MSTPYLSPEIEPEASGSQMPTPRMTSNDERAEKDLDRSPVWPSTHGSPDPRPQQTPLMQPKEEHHIDQDQNEATAALLMLNRDRRLTDPSNKSGIDERQSGSQQPTYSSPRPRSSMTGMSVMELLS